MEIFMDFIRSMNFSDEDVAKNEAADEDAAGEMRKKILTWKWRVIDFAVFCVCYDHNYQFLLIVLFDQWKDD